MAVLILPSRRLWKPPVGAQIDFGHPLADRLMASYLANEAGGLKLIDSALVNHKTCYDTSWTPTIKGDAISFNGSSAYTEAANPQPVSKWQTQPFSVEVIGLWRALPTDYWSSLIGYEDGNGYYGWQVEGILSGGTKYLIFRLVNSTGGTIVQAVTTVELDTVYHIIGTDDGTNITLYVDGVQVDQESSGTPVWTSTMYCYMGAVRPTASPYWTDGWIAKASVWGDRCLTPSEVQQLYAEPYCFIQPITRRFYSIPAAAITLELRSSSDTDARIALQTGINLELNSTSDSDARISLDTSIALSLRSSSDTDARISLGTGVSLSLRSSSDSDARISLDSGISLDLRSSTDTDARITLEVVPSLVLRSSSDTDARIALETGISISLRSSTDTDARITLTIAPTLELRSSSDTDARIALVAQIALSLRSSTGTRATIEVTLRATELELRSSTGTRGAISLDTLISLILLSQTATRAALALAVVFRHQAITMVMQGRSLTMKIPARTFGQEVYQDDG